MKIGPHLDPGRVQRNSMDAATGTAIGRGGFLGTTLDPVNLFALNSTIKPA